MLTSQQLLEEGIITKVPEECIQQVGIDLQVQSFRKITGTGFIPKVGKTILPTYEEVAWGEDNCVTLTPGSYEVVFEQGCSFPNNVAGQIIHRSSVLRSGAILFSAIFDSGFTTENMGSFITVNVPIKVEKGARLGQIVCHRTDEVVTNVYQGQFQKDVQRGKEGK